MLTTGSTLYSISPHVSLEIYPYWTTSHFPFLPAPGNHHSLCFYGLSTICVYVCVCVCVRTHTHTQSCSTLCNPMNCSLPGSSVRGVFQAKILEWVTISSSRGSFWPRNWAHISCVSCTVRWLLYHCTTYMTLTTLDNSHK